jgi:recombination protein U
MPFKRRGAESGSGFQEAINRANMAYERIGRACITRKAIPGRFLIERRFVPESKAEPDYGGTVGLSGRAIFYDAKTTRREVLDFDNLHAHQIGFLERMARLGAIAGFLVEFSRCGEVYFLPIQVLARWRDTLARRSLPYQFFAANLALAPQGKGFLLYDYLSAIEEQEQRYGSDYAALEIVAPTRRARKIS